MGHSVDTMVQETYRTDNISYMSLFWFSLKFYRTRKRRFPGYKFHEMTRLLLNFEHLNSLTEFSSLKKSHNMK